MNPEMLELVLTELLEEQKKETLTNGEMVSIVKKLLAKVEAIEQLLHPDDSPSILERLRTIQITGQSGSEKPAIQSAQITPVQTVVKHHFYFKTTSIIAISFFMIIVILTWLYLGKGKQANAYKENDIKYRYLKLNASANLKKILRVTDSLYLFAADSIQKKVLWIERQQQEQRELSEKTSMQKTSEKQTPKRADKKQLSK
jgi:preprotein translocase subunit SecG